MSRCFLLIVCFCLASMGLKSLKAQTQDSSTVEDWIRQSAIPFDVGQDDFGSMEQTFSQARIIALGEATHGQHEVFEIKRQLTMHLIEKQGIRLVAYEASAAKMLETNEYLTGKSDDRNHAMDGFGMLIWQIEENAALLDDLRAWNQTHDSDDQVRLIGFDAQDTDAVMKRLILLIGNADPELVSRIRDLAIRSKKAIGEMMAGNRANWELVTKEIEALRVALQKQSPPDSAQAAEYDLRVQEFLFSLTIFGSRGERDQAMAELLLKQLEQAGQESRCVVWAHNAHVQLSPLGYLGSTDLAMGGHLAKKLGDRYYAIGVAFGEGEFQANAPAAKGGWGFRRYRLSRAPENSLEWTLSTAGHERYLLDLRKSPTTELVQRWLHSGHGQRWFGGYSVPDDCDLQTQDTSRLSPTTPRADFDGLLYVRTTTSAIPLDVDLVLPEASK